MTTTTNGTIVRPIRVYGSGPVIDVEIDITGSRTIRTYEPSQLRTDEREGDIARAIIGAQRRYPGALWDGAHTHSVTSVSDDYGWTSCIDPERHGGPSGAHGGIVRTEHCLCGADRDVEINCSAQHAGPWHGQQNP